MSLTTQSHWNDACSRFREAKIIDREQLKYWSKPKLLELFEDQRRIEPAKARAAMLLTCIDTAKAKLAERFQPGTVHMPRLVPFGRMRA